MKKLCLTVLFSISLVYAFAQTVSAKLEQAVQRLLADEQMEHAILGFTVIDASTGEVIYQKNGKIGLAPASTQKVITSVTAFETLSPSYRYTTAISIRPSKNESSKAEDLYVEGSGDPSLGSNRWKESSPELFITNLKQALKQHRISEVSNTKFFFVNKGFSEKAFPDGWIWQDIGNYYGARHSFINWKENSFEIQFTPGSKQGEPVESAIANPKYVGYTFETNELSTGAKGSGDSAYVYLDPNANSQLFIAGTVPAGEKNFAIRAAHPDPVEYLADFLKSNQIAINDSTIIKKEDEYLIVNESPDDNLAIYTHHSPPLDSLNFWFMRRSINLYGEAFLRTMALEKTGFGSAEKGTDYIRDFWASRGIDKASLYILDGSGLSPQNRITTNALTKVLHYAQGRPWYTSFHHSLPLINGMKMKSGSILGARAYAGYHTSKVGKRYIYAIIVNNYSGSGQGISRAMWRLLDVLK